MQSTPLGAQYRLGALQQMAEEEFDVLVIGGGVVGAGAALDAATRGLSVALVEARDWAAGTSSRSSKLIHGGLRYLEQRDFGLVREALTERSLLLNRIAPHLVRPVPFLLPLRHRVWERFYIGAGVMLYDTMGGARTLPRHRHLTKTAALRRAPGLRSDSLVGAIQYYDAQVDDARFVMALARTAAQYGARVATRTRVTGLLREGGRVTGAVVRDLEGGGQIEVRARQVVAATGVWTDDIHELAQLRGVDLGAGVQGRAPGRAARPHRPAHRADLPDREERAVHHPVGPALAGRHHGHRLGPGPRAPGGQPRRHRVPARTRQRGAQPSR